MTVTFCGHRQLFDDKIALKERLHNEVEKLIEQGAVEFLLGGYGAFDFMCAETVRNLKNKYPHIKSVIVLAYMDRKYDESLYDLSEYPPIEKTPPRYAIIKRNEYMVQKADTVITYIRFDWGGAAKSRDYAVKKNKRIIAL